MECGEKVKMLWGRKGDGARRDEGVGERNGKKKKAENQPGQGDIEQSRHEKENPSWGATG